MQVSIRQVVSTFIAAVFICDASARAAVFLSFTNNGATPTSVSVSAGSSFPVQVKVTSGTTSTNDMVTAVDYFLESTTTGAAPVSGIFTILSRNSQTDGSAFGSPYESDSTVPTLAAGPQLNPHDTTDLGASQTNATDAPISNATAIVADYVLSVAASATPGTYLLTTFDNGSEGYSDASFNDHTFSNQGSYSVTITPAASPEPAAAGLLILAGLAALCRRQRRANPIFCAA